MTTLLLFCKSFGLAFGDQLRSLPRISVYWYALYILLVAVTLLAIQLRVELGAVVLHSEWWWL